MFGFNKKSKLEKLLEVDHSARSKEWLTLFTQEVKTHTLYCNELQPVHGPDNLPYINLFLTPGKHQTDLTKISDVCFSSGLGVALFLKEGSEPAWVFSCGDMVALKLHGHMFYDTGINGKERYKVQEAVTVQLGVPNGEILPKQIREMLRDDLINNLNIKEPRILLCSNPQMKPPHTLFFNINQSDYPDEKTFYAVMRRIFWYLPKFCPVSGYHDFGVDYCLL